MTLAARDGDNTAWALHHIWASTRGVHTPALVPVKVHIIAHSATAVTLDTGPRGHIIITSVSPQTRGMSGLCLCLHFTVSSKTIPGPKHDTQSNKSAKK